MKYFLRCLALLIGFSLPLAAVAQTGQRYNVPYTTAFDSTGVVSPGAQLFFYQTNTSTPATTYSDVNLAFPNANPVVANGAGLFPSIFLSPSQVYKVILEDANGNQIWSADPVSIYTTPSTFGLTVTCKNTSSDTTALLAAISTVEAAGGGTIFISAGTCDVTQSLAVSTSSGVYFVGQGQTATTIAASGTFNVFSFSGGYQNGGVSNLTINAQNLTAGYNDIAVNNYSRFSVQSVTGTNTQNFLLDQSSNVLDVDTVHVFNVAGTYCFEFLAPGAARSDDMNLTNVQCGGGSGSTYVGILANGYVNTINIHNFAVSAPNAGGIVSKNTNSGTAPPTYWFIHDFQVEQSSGNGITLTAATAFYCSNCYSSSNTDDGVYIGVASSDVHFSDPFMELNGTYGIENYAYAGGTGTTGLSVTGGNVTANSQTSSGTDQNILIGASAANTIINGVDLSGNTTNYGVKVLSGALYTVLSNNNYTGATSGAIDDVSGDAAILGGIGADGVAYGPNISDGGTSGDKQLTLRNGGVAGGTIAQFAAVTGTANANASFGNVDGSTPTAEINTGIGDTGGLTISTGAGPITLTPAGASVIATKPLALQGYTVATLPSCGSGIKGAMAYVTDASSPTYNGALTGSSSTIVPVFCNGSSWSSH